MSSLARRSSECNTWVSRFRLLSPQRRRGRNRPYTAYAHYELLKSKGLVKTTRDIPAGALVFFTTGQPAGHVAIYAGNGKAYSNDYVRNGCIDLTPKSTMSRGGRFLGWSPPVFPSGSRL